MTLNELIEELKKLQDEHGDCIVVLQRNMESSLSDGEWPPGYSPIGGVVDGLIWSPGHPSGHDAIDPDWSADEAEMHPDDWEEMKTDAPRCVLIFPYS